MNTKTKNRQGLQSRGLRYAPRKVRPVIHRTATAAETIGPLVPGVHVTGLTAGQFSAIDAMEHMVDELGPASVRVSTWTTGIYDIHRAGEIRIAGRITDIRLLLDRATFEKSPKFAGPLIEILGVNAFRCLCVHAKVIIVSGARGSGVMRSSMNLNKNLRTEQFDLDVCDEISGFYTDWFDGLWDQAGITSDNQAIIQAVYDRYKVGETEEIKSRPCRKKRDISMSVDDLNSLIGT